MNHRRRLGAGVCAMVLAASGCGGDSEPSAAPPVDLEGPASSSTSAATSGDGETAHPDREVGEQRVGLGEFADQPQAVAVGEFYEALWTSYQSGTVTPALARLTTGSALKTFRDRVKEYRERGYTVADLTAAQVTQVQGGTVFVCMASASYQRVEARTGAAVDPPEDGFTQYQVHLQSASPPWRVDTIIGTKNVPCGKAAS